LPSSSQEELQGTITWSLILELLNEVGSGLMAMITSGLSLDHSVRSSSPSLDWPWSITALIYSPTKGGKRVNKHYN